MHEHNRGDVSLCAVLVLPLARLSDLPLLREGFKQDEMQALYDELDQAAANLPDEVADALVHAALNPNGDTSRSLQILGEHLPVLLEARLKKGGMIPALLEGITKIFEDRRNEHASVRPQQQAFAEQVRQAVVRLGDPRVVRPEDVERAAAGIDVPDLSIGFIEMCAKDDVTDLEQLVQALAIRRGLQGTPLEAEWGPVVANEASRAIGRLEVRSLFELRLCLLDELIRKRHPALSEPRLYFQRANTRRALHFHDPEARMEVKADLEHSMIIAEQEGDLNTFAESTAAWGRVVSEELSQERPSATGDARSSAVQKIDAALALPLTDELKTPLMQARAHLIRPVDAPGAAEVIQAAVDISPSSDPLRWELAAELVITLTMAGEVDRATSLGRSFLDEVPEEAGDIAIGMLLSGVGQAVLKHSGPGIEPRQLYEAALDRFRGQDSHNEATTRIQLLNLGLTLDDSQLVEEQRRVLHDRWDGLDDTQKSDLTRLDATGARLRNEAEAAREALDSGIAATAGTRREMILRLQRVLMDLEEGKSVPELEQIVTYALDKDLDDEERPLVFDICCNHGKDLAPEVLRRVASLASAQVRPGVQAGILIQLDDKQEAEEVLRNALAGTIDVGERLACTHQLLVLVVGGRTEEAVRICEALEEQLESIEDAPVVRIDLAEALRTLAQGNRDMLERSWRHGRQALRKLNRPQFVEQAHRVLALTLDALLRARMPESSSDQARMAGWLLGQHPLKPVVIGGVRLNVAHILLLCGPCCHLEAVTMAEKLIGLAQQDLGPEQKVLDLAARQAWISNAIEGQGSSHDGRECPVQGPLDDMPAWAVDLVAGRSTTISAEDLNRSDLPLLSQALRVRPEMADHVLASLLPLVDLLTGKTRQDLLDLIEHQVLNTGRRDADDWPQTKAAMEALPSSVGPELLGPIVERLGCDVPSIIPASKPRKRYSGNRRRAEACFHEAVALMDRLQIDPSQNSAHELIGQARELLTEAAQIGQKKKLPQRFDFLVSLGNAWKREPGADIEKALGIYARAAKLKADKDQRAKLWKVTADALIDRGGEDDLREAERMLVKALEVRRGWLAAETLWSAFRLTLVHPDLDEVQRLTQAAGHLMRAVREDPAFAERLLPPLLDTLASWRRVRPDDRRIVQYEEELRKRYPNRGSDIDQGGRAFNEKMGSGDLDLVQHPAVRVVVQEVVRLQSFQELEAQSCAVLDRLEPAAAEQLREHFSRETISGDLEAIRRRLDELGARDHPDEEIPGVRVAEVHLAASLVRAGKGAADNVQRLSQGAQAAALEVEDPRARVFLLRALAEVWIPEDHVGDPVRDFGLGLELMREVMALEGGVDNASVQTLGHLARALRYAPTADTTENLAQAEQMYQLYLERAEAQSLPPDVLASARHCLAEVRSQMARGDRLARLQVSEQETREALDLAQSPEKRAELTSQLAWQRTEIGLATGEEQGLNPFREALATFDQVDPDLLPESRRENHRLLRAVCESLLARREQGPEAEQAIWRDEIKRCDRERNAYSYATMQHNLAYSLLNADIFTPDDLREGIQLCEEADKVRNIENNPRHNWETTILAGGALARALLMQTAELPWRPHKTWHEARKWLRKSVEAVRRLGAGKELLDSAFNMVGLCPTAGSLALAAEVAEEAWAIVGEASPYLLLNERAREEEAKKALGVCRELATRLANEGLSIPSSELAYVMESERAETVMRWLSRSHAPLRRPLQARIQRPPQVSTSIWMAWQEAIREGDPVGLVEPLAAVRDQAPGFLSETPDLTATWKWLADHPGAVGIAAVFGQPASSVIVLQCDRAGRKRVRAIGIDTQGKIPGLSALLEHLGQHPVNLEGAARHHDEAVAWVRCHIIEPVLRYLGSPPSLILWCPGPGIRLLSPRTLWRDVPVVNTLSLDLPVFSSAPARPPSALVVLADSDDQELEPLGEHGRKALVELTGAAKEWGPVRSLATVATRQGGELIAVESDGPASTARLLSEAREHGVLVVIAHGEASSPEEAALVFADDQGNSDRLTVEMISRSPERFTGSLVLLLSCDSGRVGDRLADPGGVAGALIAAGARAVVAPLWPVHLDVATEVIKGVLKSLANGEEPWEALVGKDTPTMGDGPFLGPSPSLSRQKAVNKFQQLAFVTWVG